MADHVHAEPNADAARTPPRPQAPQAAGAAGGSPFTILRPRQGIHVRWGTAVGAGLLAIGLAYFVYNKLALIAFIEQSFALRTLIPVVVLVAAAYGVFWAVGRSPRIVEFLVATEDEMKKVSWSSRREVWGATKVVIVTVLALAFILFAVDVVFILFFGAIGVLEEFNIIQQLMGSGNT
jgi:preprotein translocase subunit SecE